MLLRHLTAFALALVAGLAHGASESDRAVLAAYDAFRAGDAAQLARQASRLEGHALAPYLDYWRLRLRLDTAGEEELRGFLAAHAGSYPAEMLRTAWLKELGRSENWVLFERERGALAEEDSEIRCYALASRLARGDTTAFGDAARIWLEPKQRTEACSLLSERVAAAGQLTEDDIWRRLRVLFEAGQIPAARRTLARFPLETMPAERDIAQVATHPQEFLARPAAQFERRSGRGLAVLATIRLAARDPRAAARALENSLAVVLKDEETRYLWGRIACEAARGHLPEALDWYRRAGNGPFSDEQLAWKARAALRQSDWTTVREAVDPMSAEARRDPAWTYWYARALAAQGNPAGARAYYLRIAGGTDFYGLLASEELGFAPAIPGPVHEPAESDIDAARRNPGLARALELQRLGLREEARHEWAYAIRDLDDETLLAASALALESGAYDRSINTANRTLLQHNYRMRYPAPFHDLFRVYAQAHGVDEAWLFGLVRQESRFVPDARSVAGARGLMQILPRTADWVARLSRHNGYRRQHVAEVDTNVRLGTRYLRIVLDELGHPVLASAAYNAGPRRARAWRDERPLEGAIYAETIPLDETRDYVKKVMANTVFYAILLNGRTEPLKQRMGTVGSRVRPSG